MEDNPRNWVRVLLWNNSLPTSEAMLEPDVEYWSFKNNEG